MFKRLRWMTLGFLLGAGLFVWARNKAKQAPAKAIEKVSEKGLEIAAQAQAIRRDFMTRVSEAVAEGREAMHEREAELRAEVFGDNGATNS